jgi:hypothetical protein
MNCPKCSYGPALRRSGPEFDGEYSCPECNHCWHWSDMEAASDQPSPAAMRVAEKMVRTRLISVDLRGLYQANRLKAVHYIARIIDAELAGVRKVMRELEWDDFNTITKRRCPMCVSPKTDGHAHNCKLAAARRDLEVKHD